MIITILAREPLSKNKTILVAKMAVEAAIMATHIRVEELRFYLYGRLDDAEIKDAIAGSGCIAVISGGRDPQILPAIKRLISTRAHAGEPPIVILGPDNKCEIHYKYPSKVDDAYHLALNIKNYYSGGGP